MKTIEEKAKAYDEALERAKEWEGNPAAIDYIFPELAESEDEKVRQKILFLFYSWRNNEQVNIPNKKEVEKAISWLEKQGEHANFRNKIQVGDKVTRNEAGVLVNLSQLKRVAKPMEKQDEKHPDPYNGISFEYNGHTWGMCARDNGVDISCDKHLIKHLEEQGEKLPVGFYYVNSDGKKFYSDTFKYGDVILHVEKQGETFPVLSNSSNIGKDEQKPLGYVHHIDEDGYYTKEAILEPNPYTGTGFDYNGHHWGMCARDGGVEILMDGNITSRVFPDKNNIIEQKPTDSYCQENCKGFQETGKCFADGECKAKREAEQKPVIKFKTAEESLGISSDEYNKIVDECIFGEQKPEENKGNIGGISANWSEEDERLCQCLIEDQEEFLDRVINDKYGHSEIISDLKEIYHKRIDWLKSLKGRLKPQNHWKPSDEQMGCLSDAIEHYNSLGYPATKLKELYEQLKKL